MTRRRVHKLVGAPEASAWCAECSGPDCQWVISVGAWYLAFRYAVAHVCGPTRVRGFGR